MPRVQVVVNGTGSVTVYRNGTGLGDVINNGSRWFDFSYGDSFGFLAQKLNPDIEFSKFQNENGETTTQNPFNGHIIKYAGTITAVFEKPKNFFCDTLGIGCVQPPVPSTGNKTAQCPKGTSYSASTLEIALGCPTGYHRPLFGNTCDCDLAPGKTDTTTFAIYGAIGIGLLYAISQFRRR